MKSFETSGMFVQEMILVAFFLLILVEIRLLCVQHSRKQKVEVMAAICRSLFFPSQMAR